jgi:protein-arginine kinase activator protein McsA
MELTLADFVLYVVLGAFVAVVFLAMVSRYLHNRVEKRSLSHRVICRLCLHAFEDTSHVKNVSCPACGAANEKGRFCKLR